MPVTRVIRGVQVVPMGFANAFLIEGDDGLTLIDAGFPDKEAAVFEAIRGLGFSPSQLKHLIFTHGHPDHIGSAGAIVRETGARVACVNEPQDTQAWVDIQYQHLTHTEVVALAGGWSRIAQMMVAFLGGRAGNRNSAQPSKRKLARGGRWVICLPGFLTTFEMTSQSTPRLAARS